MTTVLVVEDDPTILETVAYNLRRDGFDVMTATDGIAGLSVARTIAPDLVVLDLMLPRMSGADVCRLLRAELPVLILMLTARDSEQDKIGGLELGADDYMTKPFSMRELVARVHALLRRDRLSREAGGDRSIGKQLVGGGLVLDASTHEVTRDGAVIALRPKEFDILEYMLRHPNQALSRDRMLEAIWGYAYGGETRTVDVHVHWLREKVEVDPADPRYIQTVRGVGYKFVP